MHEEHRRAAELHELAAKAHRTAAEHNERGDHAAAIWHLERALKYADQLTSWRRKRTTSQGK